MAGRSAIVGSEFCLGKEVELVMRQEWCTAFGGFTVKDTSGNDVFKVGLQIYCSLTFFVEICPIKEQVHFSLLLL